MRSGLAFAALFVLGLAGTGYVIATAPEQATGPHTLELTATEAPANATVTPFETLSEIDRRLVRTAVDGNGSARVSPDHRPNASYVRHEGSVYRLRVVVGDPDDGTTFAHLLAVLVGGGTAVLGALGLTGLLLVAWQRDRENALE